MLFATGTFMRVLKANVASAVCTRLVMVQKSFGPTFTHVSGAPEAPVSYFKGFGGQPGGKTPPSVMVELGDRPLVGTIKGRLKS